MAMTMKSHGVSIPVSNEACRWLWNPEWKYEEMKKQMDWLLSLFPQKGEVPIMIGSSSHEYFNVWKVNLPFEITDQTHPIYTACTYPEFHRFAGVEGRG